MKKITLYTDGACSGNPGVGGWGAVLMYNGYEKRISAAEECTTNNRMEVTAVIEGLKCLKEACIVDVYSDSAYTVNAFNRGWIFDWERSVVLLAHAAIGVVVVEIVVRVWFSRFNLEQRAAGDVTFPALPLRVVFPYATGSAFPAYPTL